jgi:hypothetical protein
MGIDDPFAANGLCTFKHARSALDWLLLAECGRYRVCRTAFVQISGICQPLTYDHRGNRCISPDDAALCIAFEGEACHIVVWL